MFLRPLAACIFTLFMVRFIREIQPSRYGVILGGFLLYLPLMSKLQLNLAPGVNLVTLFCIALLFHKREESEPPRGEHEAAFRSLLYAWMAICGWGFCLGLGGPHDFVDLAVLLKRWLDPIFASLLALRLTKQEDRKFVLGCMLLGFTLVGLQGLRAGLDYGDKIRIGGLFDQPNDLGAFLAMYTPIGLVTALFLTNGMLRYAVLWGLYVGSWALLYTQSRAALVALPLGILTILFRSGRAGLGFIGLVLAVVIWVFPETLPEQATARFETTYVEKGLPGAKEQLEDSAANRVKIWTGAVEMITQNPLGVGLAQFPQQIGRYAKLSGPARDAHNFYLLVCAELGVVGLLVLLMMLWRVLTIAWTVSRRSTDALIQPVGLGMLACVLATIVVNFFGSRLMTLQVSTYFWVLAAILVRAYDCQLVAERGPIASTANARVRRRMVGVTS
jgi:O-antigen ligase